MVVNERPLKRAKRRVTADLCDFLTFPEDAAGFDGPFRDNVRTFLLRHGRPLAALPPPPPSILAPAAPAGCDEPHLLIWRVAFRVGGGGGCEGTPAAEVELDVVAENVPRSKSIYCDQCRVVGWSDHPVCGKRYHFIIRNDKNSLSSSGMVCIRCGTLLSMSNLRCYSCNCEVTFDTFEGWAHKQLEDSTHLLHGIVHANGYGHLLRVNGKEGGSKYLSGRDIMSFWDRLCKMLRIRKVSVMDISKKHGMEYRLLHGVIAGHPWYGNWGYKFGSGSFALTAESYNKAVDTLSKVPLSIFFSRSRYPRSQLQNTIGLYWSLSEQLLTVRDLFCCVMDQLRQASTPASQVGKKSAEAAGVLCPWTRDAVERAEEVIAKFLRSTDRCRWVTWRTLRGAACHGIEPPELLDYCLRGLGGKHVGDGLKVAVRYNAETKAVEYRLEAATNQLPTSSRSPFPRPSVDEVIRDLKFLYDALLNPNTMQTYKPIAVRECALNSAAKLLDCKQFIRHYDEPASYLLPSNPFAITIWCHVELVDHPEDYTAPPPELVVLPASATVADLKLQVTKTFQETYLIFQRFQAEQLLNYERAGDATPIKILFGSCGGVARIRGRCLGNDQNLRRFRKERGLENWIVDCTCGAKDDDGERMMACDACGVWQHTRCAGIDDFDDVPGKFVCKECEFSGVRKYKGLPRNDNPNVRCKDEIGTNFTNAGRLATVG